LFLLAPKQKLNPPGSFFSVTFFLSAMETQSSQPSEPQNRITWIFFNERELRAGWRLLIFLAVLVAVTAAFGAISLLLLGKSAKSLSAPSLILQEAVSFLCVVFASWIMSKIEHRSMEEYGLPLRNSRALSRFVTGYLFWGFLPLSALLLGMRALQSFYFGKPALHDGQIVYWAAVWGVLFCLVGLFEEYLLRGYLLYTLADGIGFWPAAIVLASVFGLLHSRNPGESRIGVLMTVFFAMFASVLLRYTGNLWLAVGAHAGWDWGQSYFYGVSDSGLQLPGHFLSPHIRGPEWLSGGSVGPEGSILCLALMTVMTALVIALYRGRAPHDVLISP
jgi:uncharacterized protein